jgi:hypothetical protein
MAEPPLPIRDPVQADEAVPEDAHPRGTLIVITLFGLPFALHEVLRAGAATQSDVGVTRLS